MDVFCCVSSKIGPAAVCHQRASRKDPLLVFVMLKLFSLFGLLVAPGCLLLVTPVSEATGYRQFLTPKDNSRQMIEEKTELKDVIIHSYIDRRNQIWKRIDFRLERTFHEQQAVARDVFNNHFNSHFSGNSQPVCLSKNSLIVYCNSLQQYVLLRDAYFSCLFSLFFV